MTYIWPLPEGTPISQHFGDNPNNGVNPSGGHTGTDFAVPVGTPVRAIGHGVVKFADWASVLPADYRQDGSGSNPYWLAPGFGGIVTVIDHGACVSVYAHLSEAPLNAGDTVEQGQVIALSGDTGGATTGPHLHFETLPDGWNFENGTYGRVDPATFCTGYWSDIQPASSGDITPIGGFLMALNDAQQQEVYDRLEYIASPEFKVHIFNGQSDEEKAARQGFHDEGAGAVWSYKNPNLGGGDAYQFLRDATQNPAAVAQQIADAGAAKPVLAELVKILEAGIAAQPQA